MSAERTEVLGCRGGRGAPPGVAARWAARVGDELGKVAEFQKPSSHQPEFSQEPHHQGGKLTPAELLP